MTSEPPLSIVEFKAIAAKIRRAFGDLLRRLNALLPEAQIEEIGSTAIGRGLTKGDLDVLVRIRAERFEQADLILATAFDRNIGSERNAELSSFKIDESDPPIGIQLVARDSRIDRQFRAFRDRLRAEPLRCAEYDALKRRFVGRPMNEYRLAKGEFIARVLSEM